MTQTIKTASQRFHAPELVTKQLKLNCVGDRRKVRLSSNFLPLMGFQPETRVSVSVLKDGGFQVSPDPAGEHKVHLRRYRRGRSNNPLETVVEFASQSLIRGTFPPGVDQFHIQMRKNQLQFRPVPNRVFNIRQQFSGRDPLRALVALTGGVDVHCLEQLGFKTDIIVEHRPTEARDRAQRRYINEVHALNCLRNASPRVVVNEDFYELDPAMLRQWVDEGEPISVAHFSIGCDDFSFLKSESMKERSVADGSTMVDMVYPLIRAVETLGGVPVVVVENVRGFMNSGAGTILRSMLTRFGYHVSENVLCARDHGGHQNRERYYLVASLFPGYVPPSPFPRKTDSIWPIIEPHLADCRDVSHCKTVKNRATSGRNVPPLLNKDSQFCPTIIKSQGRGVRDAVYLEHEGRILAPSEGLLKDLMSIDPAFDTSWMAQDLAIETLGQSIDGALHSRVMAAVKAHIQENLGPGPVLRHAKQLSLAI